MSDDRILKSFQFHIPIDLVKSESSSEEEGDWIIHGIASTGDEDLQGEIVDQNGLDISLLKAGQGIFNNDHQKGIENVLGQIEDADFIEVDGRKALMVKGYLFKHQPRAQAYYNVMRSLKKGSSKRVCMSIEGKILQRDNMNGRMIRKARIDKVALTLDPVNPYTFADLAKSLMSGDLDSVPEAPITVDVKELQDAVEAAVKKAMAVGDGGECAPSERTGASALVKESLESKLTKISQKPKKKKKQLLKSILRRLAETYPSDLVLKIAKPLAETLKNQGEGNV